MTHRPRNILLVSLAAVLASWLGVAAQTGTGSITGSVTDEGGGIIPGTTVTVTNRDTGRVREALTDDVGRFAVRNLPPGPYVVRAALSGFRASVRDGLTLTVGRTLVVDLVLQVGAVTEEVTVTGEAPLIETTGANLEGLIDDKKIRDLPLNGRSFLELMTLQTGTSVSVGDKSATKGFGTKISVSGQRYNANAFLLDGAVINDATGTTGSAAGLLMGVETVREFSVVTSAYSSEYGRHTGGIVNAVTKSGTNQLHGSVFWFLRNDNLDAANFFDNSRGTGKPEFKRNQFGFTLGGPIVPDRTFFFGSYEGLRDRLGLTQSFNVPSRAVRDGFLGGEFIGVDPDVQPYMDAYPEPTGPDQDDGTAIHARGVTAPTDQDYLTIKVDHNFSAEDSLFVRYTFDDAEGFTPSSLNTAQNPITRNQYLTIEESHIFSPQVVNSFQFSFNRTNLNFFDSPLPGFPFPGGQISFSDQTDIVGIINNDDFSTWGGGTTNPKEHVQNNFQTKDDLFWTKGDHSLKFGVQAERIHFNQRSDFNAMGVFGFGGVRDFMLNQPSQFDAIRPGSDNRRGWRQWLIGLYLQDDWQVAPRLTLNLGMRYEFVTTPKEVNGKVANIRNLNPESFFFVDVDETDVGDPYFDNPSLTNFAPRLGMAWDPFGNGKTSIRAGVGVFHDQILPNYYITSGVRMEPFFGGAAVVSNVDFPDAFFTQIAIGGAGSSGLPRVEGLEYDANQPTVYKWSVDIQQEILPNTLLDIGYAGTQGQHLVRGAVQLNHNPWDVVDGRFFYYMDPNKPRFVNTNFDRMRWRLTDGEARYHSFRLGIDKRFSDGFQIQSSFTWSKSIDDSSTWTGSSDFGSSDRRGFHSFKFRGLSGFDVRRNFYTNFTWALPGQNMQGAAGAVAGGWSISGLLRFNDGNPINIRSDQIRNGGLRLRYVDGSSVNLVSGGDNSPINPQNPDQYYDFTPFEFIELSEVNGFMGSFEGNLGRNTLIVPGVANVDLSLAKNFQTSEESSIQFRAEFFNIFNRANFSVPDERIWDRRGRVRSSAGRIDETNTTARQIQFALKFIF